MNAGKKIFLIALLVVLIYIALNFQEPSEPREFVKNKTFTNYSNLFFSYEISRYPSNVEITPLGNLNETTIGFATEPWNINFGVIPGNGSYVERNVELTNLKDRDSKINFKAYGNISPMVIFSKNNFIVQPGKKVSVSIFLYSNQMEPGNYSGEIDIVAKKSIYNFISIS